MLILPQIQTGLLQVIDCFCVLYFLEQPMKRKTNRENNSDRKLIVTLHLHDNASPSLFFVFYFLIGFEDANNFCS